MPSSRSSFPTGRYPRTTRLRQNGQNIPPEERLVTRLLADAGYICGMVGKLHITAGDAEAGLVAESRIDDGLGETDEIVSVILNIVDGMKQRGLFGN